MERHGKMRRRPCEDRRTGGNDTATNQEIQTPEEAEKDSPLEPPEGAQPYQHFGFKLLPSRTVRGYIPAVYFLL